jgi:hypothetical protein
MKSKSNLTINNKTVVAETQSIGGQTFVLLRDVAKALDCMVFTEKGGYRLASEGGANQVGDKMVKVGQEMFDGRWKLTLTKIERVSQYRVTSNQPWADYSIYNPVADYDNDTKIIKPRSKQTLMVAHFRLKNGMKNSASLWVAQHETHTAITDTSEGSYPPILYDFESTGPATRDILPGAALEFNVLFVLPERSTQKDIVFTLRLVDKDAPKTDVRIAL